jgi:hypothetical protein
MNVLRKAATVAAACMLSALTAVPAMALENEFHGLYRMKAFATNFDDGTISFYDPTGAKASTNSYVEQRIRLKYNAKVSDDFKLVTDFKIDSRWGSGAYNTHRKQGGEIGSDTVNLETRAAYIDFNIPAIAVNFKMGIQPWEDAYDGIFVDTQMAGLLMSGKVSDVALSLGWFRLDDSTSTPFGHHPRDLVVLDGSYALSKNLTVGGSYYMLNDAATQDTAYLDGSPRTIPTETVHTLGVNSEAKVGVATVNGYFLYQFGDLDELVTGANRSISAFAGGAGAKAKLGFGTVKASFLYASGDKNSGGSKAFRDVEDLDGGIESDYSSDMRILRKDQFSGASGKAIVATINNKDQGVIFGSAGYDVDLTDKVFAGANVGFAAAAEDNANKPVNINTGARNSSSYLGTELNAAIGYKLNPNATIRLRGAYAILGDYYKGVAANGADPDNPFSANIMLVYAF